MRRRAFLAKGCQAALGLCGFPAVVRALDRKTGDKAGDAESVVTELETLIPRLMREGSVPGVSIVLLRDASPIWARGFGVKDVETKTPVDFDTIFAAASVSKSVFAYAVMKLCEQRVLNLDTPLTRHTKSQFLGGDSRLDLITPRHLLCHTSGFQNWRSDDDPLKIHFPPGERFMYSGEGYSYLQSVVTEMTGQPVEEFMQARVFKPFGMTASGYVWSDLFEGRAARGHDRDGNPLEIERTTPEHAARYAAAGALHTTPSDYARLLTAILDSKASPGDEAFQLSQAGVSEMLRPHIKVDDSNSWALGWKIQHTPEGDLFQHHGGHRGAQAFASASYERKTGYVVMTNAESGWKVFFNEQFVATVNRFLLTKEGV